MRWSASARKNSIRCGHAEAAAILSQVWVQPAGRHGGVDRGMPVADAVLRMRAGVPDLGLAKPRRMDLPVKAVRVNGCVFLAVFLAFGFGLLAAIAWISLPN